MVLVSFLDKDGIPGIVERALILPPQSKFGTIDDFSRLRIINASSMSGKYDMEVDRESAYELLQAKVIHEEAAKREEKERSERQKQFEKEEKERQKQREKEEKERERALKKAAARTSSRKTLVERAADNVVGTIGREVGRSLIRGILGSLKR